MKPEQLVPSLELCQRAQRLGWKRETWFGWITFYERTDQLGLYAEWLQYGCIPAPTLQEVLEDIFASGYRVPTLYSAEAALELWCKLEERKAKNEQV